jgi:hypothetical protein
MGAIYEFTLTAHDQIICIEFLYTTWWSEDLTDYMLFLEAIQDKRRRFILDHPLLIKPNLPEPMASSE